MEAGFEPGDTFGVSPCQPWSSDHDMQLDFLHDRVPSPVPLVAAGKGLGGATSRKTAPLWRVPDHPGLPPLLPATSNHAHSPFLIISTAECLFAELTSPGLAPVAGRTHLCATRAHLAKEQGVQQQLMRCVHVAEWCSTVCM